MILLLVGILLAVIAMPTADSKNSGKTANSFVGGKEDSGEKVEKSTMEAQLEELLSQVEGVGEVRVMLTVKNTSKGKNRLG